MYMFWPAPAKPRIASPNTRLASSNAARPAPSTSTCSIATPCFSSNNPGIPSRPRSTLSVIRSGNNPAQAANPSAVLLQHLSLLFVPVGVGVIVHLGALAPVGWRLLAVIVLSTWVGMAVTALVLRALLRAPPGDSGQGGDRGQGTGEGRVTAAPSAREAADG